MTTRFSSVLRIALASALLLSVLALAVGAALWHHQGGRWYAVTSPSMGESMPVGSLLLTKQVPFDEVEVGDVVTFRTPRTHTNYTHRVVARGVDTLTTRGDINSAEDPLPTVSKDLVGRVVWHAWGLGWALRALPLMLVGLSITWLVTVVARDSRRYTLRMLGVAATLAVAGWVLHPWMGLVKLSQSTPANGDPGVVVDVVSTGLLPTQVFEVGGGARLPLRNGKVGTLHLEDATRGVFDLSGRLNLTWWGWLALALVVASPLLWTLVRGLPPVVGGTHRSTAGGPAQGLSPSPSGAVP